MSRQPHRLYEFGDFRLDTAERLLLRGGRAVPLTPKVFDTLLVLVENSGHILEKDDLMSLLWPDSYVEESSLAQNVFLLRKALGEGAGQRYIETIPRRGYRFVAEVREVARGDTEIVVEQRRGMSLIVEEEETAGGEAPPDSESVDGAEAGPLMRSDKGVGRQAVERPVPHRTGLAGALKRPPVVALLLAVAVAGTAAALYQAAKTRRPAGKAATAFQNMRLVKLTSTGNALHPALSPDGKYVAHVLQEGGQQSIWVRQVATNSSVKIVPAAPTRYRGLVYSPDGNFIYYLRPENNNLTHLYQIPALGGTPWQVIKDVDSPITFSPDGRQVAFVRGYPGQGESAVIVANADGTGERQVALRRQPEFFSHDGPAWSPDGMLIACAGSQARTEGRFMQVIGISPAGGPERLLTSQQLGWVGKVAWLSDGSGLVLNGRPAGANVFAEQLYLISYPDGQEQRITNDVHAYSGVSISADSKAMVSGQSGRMSRLWVVPDGDAARAREITTRYGDNFGERCGMNWLPDGRIAFGSTELGHPDIWVMDTDGGNRRQLTFGPHMDVWPVTAADGRYIVFASDRAGALNIWRMDADGNNPKRLTDGLGEDQPSLTPDGRWVVYSSWGRGQTTIAKVPIEGGAPVQLTEQMAMRPVVSPDGRLVACYYWDEASSRTYMAIIPIEGGPPVHTFRKMPHPERGIFSWTPDGTALIYIGTRDGVSNLWRQPLDGGPPQQVTDFKSDQIFRFAWSRDGRQLACERGVSIHDLVLVSDFQ